MKRISLLALSATAAMAQAPKATAPVAAAPAPAPVAAPVSYSAPSMAATTAATESSAPLAPIHDALVFGNPALPTSIAWVLTAPSDFAGGKREAAFQWAGGSPSFNGTAIAIIDQYYGAFAANGDQGQLAGGYISSAFGAGLRFNFRKTGFSSDSTSAVPRVVEQDSTFSPTSFGLVGSMPLAGLTVFAHLDWGTPETYGSSNTKSVAGNTTASTSSSSRSDLIALGAGVASAAMGDAGLSWKANLELGYSSTRPAGVSSDDVHPRYTADLTGNVGRTFTADRFILAPGMLATLGYWNEYGNTSANFAPNHQYRGNADYGYSFALVPNLSTILPVFEHWTVKGTAFAGLEYKHEDALARDKSNGYGLFQTTGPGGILGVRYERGRWAAEAQVNSAVLSNGPYFITGSGNTVSETVGSGATASTITYSQPALVSFAITANFK